jgi:hypothetical protein
MYNNDKATPADQEKFYQVARWQLKMAIRSRNIGKKMHWQPLCWKYLKSYNQEFPIAKLRWSIAHLNNGTESTFNRMKALGVGWAMQDAMYLDGDKALHRHGEKNLERMPPINTALKWGSRLVRARTLIA